MYESFPSGAEFWQLVRGGDLAETPPQREALRDFGPGERAAISVALENPGWLLFMDDVRPLRRAITLGLQAACSSVLTVALYVENKMTSEDALTILENLTRLQTLSPTLLTPALHQLAAAMREQDEHGSA
jgi:predicted nucleic acid-binding protein